MSDQRRPRGWRLRRTHIVLLIVSFVVGCVLELLCPRYISSACWVGVQPLSVVEAYDGFLILPEEDLADPASGLGWATYARRYEEFRTGLFVTQTIDVRSFSYGFTDDRKLTAEQELDLRLAYELYARGLPASEERDLQIGGLSRSDGREQHWRWWLSWINGALATAVGWPVWRLLVRAHRQFLEDRRRP